MAVKTRSGKALTPRTGFNPQTASTSAMHPRASVLTDANTPSRDIQRLVSRPAMPFENPQGSLNTPAAASQKFRSINPYGTPAAGLKPGAASRADNITNIGCGNTETSDDMMAAIGYAPKSTRSSNPIISGHPAGSSARRSGPAGARTTRRRG